jgi:tRNA modification GTPase
MPIGDTIAALSSAPGRSSRAVVRLSGPATREVLAAVLDAPPAPFERSCGRSRLRLGSGSLPILLATYRAPSSYTGEDSAELLVPGNPHLLERILAMLTAFQGVRHATPGEFTARAFLNDRLTLDQAEGVAATIAAETSDQLGAARDLLAGRTGDAYRAWGDELATLLALVEAGIDFTDQEDVVPIAPEALRTRLDLLATSMAAFLGARTGRETTPALPRVVLAGPPNAGKSTLFNALLGRRRAVVSPVAGTTRDVLAEEVDLAGALPGAGTVVLVDLAGLDDGGGVRGAIDADAQTRARDAVAHADVVIDCDPSGRFTGSTGIVNAKAGQTRIRVRTKADLPSPGAITQPGEGAPLAICALDGYNLPALRRAIADAATGARSGSLASLLPRHRRALDETVARLAEARAAIPAGSRSLSDPALVASALRGALDALGELTGRMSPDDVIGRIFATFCIGK